MDNPSKRGQLYLREWMEYRGLSDEQLALSLDVERTTVNRWRRFPSRLDPAKMIEIAEALNIEPADLFRPPDRPSLDAMIQGAPEELRQTAADIVRPACGPNN